MTVVFDPRWPNEKLARVGRELSFEWLALNRLPLPERVYFNRDEINLAGKEYNYVMMRPEWLGVYHHDTWIGGWNAVAVEVNDCPRGQRVRFPNGTVIRQAPGSFEDLTPLGVFCHEVGHHVDHTLHPKAYSRKNRFQDVVDSEEEVSSVEYNVLESFAEAIRLFITNPDLLRRGRPDRYDYITKGMGLKPLHSHGWRTVLQKAGPRVHTAARAWLIL